MEEGGQSGGGGGGGGGEGGGGEGGGGGSGGERGRRGKDGVKLFVGQVPKHMAEAQLLAMFREVALVDEVSTIKDKATKASRGCCFLICPSREEADKAVNACHNKRTLPGASSPLQVKYADGELERLEHKLFIGMLPKNVSDAEVSALFSKYGNIKDLQILRGSQQTSKAGCAFLKYETKEQALATLECINGKYRMEGSSVPLVVKWADTEKERQARRVLKAQSQAYVPNTNLIRQPSLFGALPMGYIPPYSGFGFQSPGNYGHMQHPAQNSAAFHTMMPHVNQANVLRGAVNRSFSVPGLQYPLAYPGGMMMGQRPLDNSHGPFGPAQKHVKGNSSPSPSISTSSGGQIEGPPGANLFIYHLPQQYGDEELSNAFQGFGRVLSAKVFVDKATGVSKCFGFVSYDSPEAAQAAIDLMNGFQLDGKKLKVQHKRVNNQTKPY